MKTKTHVFKTFPEFSELTTADQDTYREITREYPPVADYSFGTIMTWWSAIDNPRIAVHGDNLVISYWMPGNEKASGLSVIGTKKVDETIAEVLDYLHQTDQPVQLVHVPQFVINNIKYHELYRFEPEPDHDEFVVSVSKFVDIQLIPLYKRWKVKRFLLGMDDRGSVVKSLNLAEFDNQKILLDAVEAWEQKGLLNNTSKHETACTIDAIKRASLVGFENVCLYVDGELHAFLLYDTSYDGKYAIIDYARFSYDIPFIFEYSIYKFAGWFLENDIKYVNLVEDNGSSYVRSVKLGMSPVNYFRKYIIKPID